MTTIDSTSRTVWLMPSMIAGVDIGSWTLNSSWRGVAPNDVAASRGLARHLAQAEVDDADARRQGVDDRGDHTRHAAHPEQEDDGHQVDERRHDLRCVEHGPQDPLHPVRATGPHTDRDGQCHGDDDDHEHLAQGVHRQIPVAHRGDPDEAGPAQRTESPAAAGPPDGDNCRDDRPPRRVDEDVADRVEDVDHEEIAERARSADDRDAVPQVLVDPVDRVVDRSGRVDPPPGWEVIGAEEMSERRRPRSRAHRPSPDPPQRVDPGSPLMSAWADRPY